MVSDTTPVIIGVSQLLQRVADPLEGKEPIDMMVEAVQAAALDTTNPNLLAEIESVRVIRGVWRYKQPAGYVAAKIGVPGAETVGTPFGGNMVQSVVNQTALDIMAGKQSLVVITGAENGNSQAKARKAGVELPITETSGPYTRMIGEDKSMSSEPELARGIRAPIQVYPIFENAIRYQAGESVDDHNQRVAELWSGFSRVAAGNPHAWITEVMDATTIMTPSPTIRIILFL